MLSIKTTLNYQGISLSGDYKDLHELYDALSRYLDFYQQHTEGFPYHEYEYLLSLNYDIRHAFQGDREYILSENNVMAYANMAENMYELPDEIRKELAAVRRSHKDGNLYFSVNILYPLVFHYLASLERILDDYYQTDWFNDEEALHDPLAEVPSYMGIFGYSELNANHDRAQIRLLTSLLWDNVVDLFGDDDALAAYKYFTNQEYGFTSHLYIDALLQHQAACFDKLTEDERLEYLYAALLEILDTAELLEEPEEFPECHERYMQALDTIKAARNRLAGGNGRKNEKRKAAEMKEFPTQQAFTREFHKAFDKKDHLYENEFDQFLDDLCGEAPDDEEPEW